MDIDMPEAMKKLFIDLYKQHRRFSEQVNAREWLEIDEDFVKEQIDSSIEKIASSDEILRIPRWERMDVFEVSIQHALDDLSHYEDVLRNIERAKNQGD
jgi:hypothetical protein